jgi:hypothetical protein
MPVTTIALTDSTPKPCKGFTLEVKVVPKDNLRLHVIIDKTCVNNEAVWGLIFELEKKANGTWTQIVFVSFKPKVDDPKAQAGIEKMFESEKLTKNQIAVAKTDIIPATAQLEGSSGATPAQAKQIEAAARKMAVVEIGG